MNLWKMLFLIYLKTWTPLKTSYTQSDKKSGNPGVDEEDLTDGGQDAIDRIPIILIIEINNIKRGKKPCEVYLLF